MALVEGDMYPELRRMALEPYRMYETRLDNRYWQHNWGSLKDGLKDMRNHIDQVEIEAVRITMPKEDFERMMSIYHAHYHAAVDNPAVAEAWHQYKMLVALTQR